MKTLLKLMIVAAIVLAIVYAGSKIATRHSPTETALSTCKVQKRDIRQIIRGHGILESSKMQVVVSPVSGIIESVNGSLGQHVKNGEVLCEISRENIERDFRMSRAELDKAIVELEKLKALPDPDAVSEAKHKAKRAVEKENELMEDLGAKKRLLEKGFVSRQEYDDLEDQLEEARHEAVLADKKVQEVSRPASEEDVALAKAKCDKLEADLDTLKQQMEGCTVKAQMDGTLVEWALPDASTFSDSEKMEIGEGEKIGSIADLKKGLVVKSEVFERDIPKLKKGMEAVVYIDANRRHPVKGRVSRVSMVAETRGMLRKFPIEITILVEMDQVRLGKTLEYDIVAQEVAGTLTIPLSFLAEKNGLTGVWKTVKGSQPEFTAVETGIHDERNMQIISGGLNEGDVLILKEESKS